MKEPSLSTPHGEYLSRDDDSEIEMRETDDGIAISLRMIEDGQEMAGTTFYLRPEQVSGMAAWLSARSEKSASEFSDKLMTALAAKFGVARPTMVRWLSGEVVPEPAFQDFVLKAIYK